MNYTGFYVCQVDSSIVYRSVLNMDTDGAACTALTECSSFSKQFDHNACLGVDAGMSA